MSQLKPLSRHLYNQYSSPHIYFLDKQNQSNTLSIPEKENNTLYKDLNVISDVDIEPQMNDPITSFFIVTIFGIILLPSVISIQTRTLKMLKSENSINTRMMKSQARLHMTFWPSAIFLHALVDNIYPLSAVTSPHLCTVMNMLISFAMISMILYSLYAAILRYLYLVQEKIVVKFGKTEIISMVFWGYYLHTFIWSLYILLTGHYAFTYPWVSSCYGWKDRVFMLEESSSDVLLRQLGVLVTGNGNFDVFGIVLRSANLLLSLVCFLNIPEFFLYRAIYAHQKRCNDESLQRLGDIVSSKSRIIRARRINVNLKITGLAYLVEVIGGILICTLAFSSTWKLFFPFSMWYGLVVPSCYLINTDDTKTLIMEHGWLTALRRIYIERQPQNILPTQHQKHNKLEVITGANKDNDTRIQKTEEETTTNEVKENAHRFSEKNIETSIGKGGKVVSAPIMVFHISGQIRKHRISNTFQPVSPLFDIRHQNDLRKDKICNRTDVITVIDI